VPKVVLQRPRVVAIVGELEAAGVAKHVRVGRERHLGGGGTSREANLILSCRRTSIMGPRVGGLFSSSAISMPC
jgi:hypothetical protein